MDSTVVQSQVNENDEYQQPPNFASQQGEHHSDHERKSVLIMNKVKAKAKKIKNTIKKHGQNVFDRGHEYTNEDQHTPDHHNLDENEEMDEDHEVHEAPIHESEAVKVATPISEKVENLEKLGVNLESTTVKAEEEPHHEPRVLGVSPTAEINLNKNTEAAKTSVGEEEPEKPKANLDGPTGLEEDPHAKGSRPEAYTPPNYQTEITDPTGTEMDITPVEKSFARMNVLDESKPAPEPEILTNVAETQYTSAGHHSQHMPEDSSATKTQNPSAESHEHIVSDLSTATTTQYPSDGSHDHIASETSHTSTNTQPEVSEVTGQAVKTTTTVKEQYPSAAAITQYPSDGSHDQIASETIHASTDTQPEISEVTGKAFNTTTTTVEEQYPSTATTTQYPSDGSHDQIASETTHTSTITQPEISEVTGQAFNTTTTTVEEQYPSTAAITQYPSDGSHDQIAPETIHTSTNTQPEISEATGQASNITATTVEEQYPSTGATTQYPSDESHDQIAPETIHTSTNTYPEISEVTDQTSNTTKAIVEEQPSYESAEESSNKSSYTDKISSATSVIADKAVSAKNAVASKLGYGEKGDRGNTVTPHEEQRSEDASNKSGSSAENGKNIAQSLTEKLAPVYGKVAGVGSAVKSKVSGTRTVDSTGVGTEAENGVKEKDKGVSVKDYLAEKLRPGEEDKALSEVISEALHMRKEEPKEASGVDDRDVNRVISDDIHKQEEEQKVEKEHGHLGSVDEKSEKVTGESNVNSPGKGMVDKLKGVVGSWFGKSGEHQSSDSQVAEGEDLSKNKNSGAEVEQVSQAEDETRLQK